MASSGDSSKLPGNSRDSGDGDRNSNSRTYIVRDVNQAQARAEAISEAFEEFRALLDNWTIGTSNLNGQPFDPDNWEGDCDEVFQQTIFEDTRSVVVSIVNSIRIDRGGLYEEARRERYDAELARFREERRIIEREMAFNRVMKSTRGIQEARRKEEKEG